jgi:hypothetical protein
MFLNSAKPSRTRAPNSLFSGVCSGQKIRLDSSDTTSRYNPCFRDRTVWNACTPSLDILHISDETDRQKLGELPFNTPPVNLVLGYAASSAARCRFDPCGRRCIRDDLVYRISPMIKSVISELQFSPKHTQNKLGALGDDNTRSSQMLMHLHPAEQ